MERLAKQETISVVIVAVVPRSALDGASLRRVPVVKTVKRLSDTAEGKEDLPAVLVRQGLVGLDVGLLTSLTVMVFALRYSV